MIQCLCTTQRELTSDTLVKFDCFRFCLDILLECQRLLHHVPMYTSHVPMYPIFLCLRPTNGTVYYIPCSYLYNPPHNGTVYYQKPKAQTAWPPPLLWRRRLCSRPHVQKMGCPALLVALLLVIYYTTPI